MAYSFDAEFDGEDVVGLEQWSEFEPSQPDQFQRIDRDGVKQDSALLGMKTIVLSGSIVSEDGTKENVLYRWNNLIDNFYDADGGTNQAYFEAQSSLRILAQIAQKSFVFGKTEQGMLRGKYTITLVCTDPFWEDVSAKTSQGTNLSSGGTVETLLVPGSGNQITYGGAPSWPTITLNSATGLTKDIVLTNTTTSQSWTFEADVGAGKDLIVNMGAHTVTNDGSDAIDDVAHPSSDWFHLRGGASNTISVTFVGGASDLTMTISWRRRLHTFAEVV